MLTKVISLCAISCFLISCAITEVRKSGDCKIVDIIKGEYGTLEVSCPDISFKLAYDNDLDGKDPLIRGVGLVDAKKIKGEKIDPYVVETGDHEILEGWAYKEVWQVGKYKLMGFEYFIYGGTACYEEEEAGKIDLVKEDKVIPILRLYFDETDCGGN